MPRKTCLSWRPACALKTKSECRKSTTINCLPVFLSSRRLCHGKIVERQREKGRTPSPSQGQGFVFWRSIDPAGQGTGERRGFLQNSIDNSLILNNIGFQKLCVDSVLTKYVPVLRRFHPVSEFFCCYGGILFAKILEQSNVFVLTLGWSLNNLHFTVKHHRDTRCI